MPYERNKGIIISRNMINEGIRYGLLVYNKTSADTVSVSAPSFSWGYEGRIVIPSEIYYIQTRFTRLRE